ncbi:MAG: hypothetical protein OXP11_08695 [Gammaproteobacteria bacterium]|nr:hypothetical protein [Gammaproteobacteria bacterium]
MINEELRVALQPVVKRFGMAAVQSALQEFPRQDRSLEPQSRSGGGSISRKAGRRRSLNAVEYVKKMDLSEEQADVIERAAREFERGTFLPTCGDIKRFCQEYGVDELKSTSRAAGVPRIFKFLREMEVADIEAILDDRLFSGPVELGPIAEAIRGRARQNRGALAMPGRGAE